MMDIKGCQKSSGNSRVYYLSINKKEVTTPTYFPSVSSQARYSVDSYVDVLCDYEFPRLLISCYDLYDLKAKSLNNDLVSKINKFSTNGNVLFLDSGIYESSWRKDQNWLFETYSEIVASVNCDFYSSFDIFRKPDEDYSTFLERTVKKINDSRNLETEDKLVPIVHGENAEALLRAVKSVIRAFDFRLRIISVPERETGGDIMERAHTLKRIRKLLDQQGNDAILHVLGCGDPVSLALYIYSGADSFDSLDWLRFAIDPNEFVLRHLSHSVLFDCTCPYCSESKYSFFRVLLHNLHFYYRFLNDVRESIIDDKMDGFLKNHFPLIRRKWWMIK